MTKPSSTFQNITFSVLAQFARYVAPLLFFPYLIRILGADGFSVFILSFTVGQIIGQFTEFGFGLSGIREIASAKDAKHLANSAASDVFYGKLLMFFVSAPIILGLYAGLYEYDGLTSSILLPILIGIGYGFTPNWLYISLHKAKTIALFEIVVSFSQLALLLLLVRSIEDRDLALLCLGLPMLVLSAYGMIQALKIFPLERPSVAKLKAAILQSYRFFIFTNSASLANKLMILVLGLVSTPLNVTIYSASEKVISAGINTLTPINRVLMPKIAATLVDSRDRAVTLFRRTLLGGSAVYFVGAVVLALTTHLWVPLAFGQSFVGAEWMIAIFVFVVPISVVGRIVGILALVPSRKEHFYQHLTVFVTLAGLAFALPVGMFFGAIGIILLRVAMESAVAVGCLIFLRKQTDAITF